MDNRTVALLEKIGSAPGGVLLADLGKDEQRRARRLWRGVYELLSLEDVFDMSWRLPAPVVSGELLKLDERGQAVLEARRAG